jgi:DNA-binding transcriptional ArsR family regulator
VDGHPVPPRIPNFLERSTSAMDAPAVGRGLVAIVQAVVAQRPCNTQSIGLENAGATARLCAAVFVSPAPLRNRLARLAAAIAEPARARMLCSLMDGRARTSTELAVIAEVSPSTASVHLAKLKQQELVKVLAQGKHRYYSLHDERVAATLESLMVLAGTRSRPFVPNTPSHLRWARTCYDHMAGANGLRVP